MSVTDEVILEKVNRIQSEVIHQGEQQDRHDENMVKILSCLSRIEDLLYEHTHLRKKSNYSSFNEAGHVSGGG